MDKETPSDSAFLTDVKTLRARARKQIEEERLKRGEGVTAIAREYGVWHGAISSIKTGRNWGWL